MSRRCRVLFLICFLLFCSAGVSAAESGELTESVDLSLLEDAVGSLEDSIDGTVSLSELLDDMIHGNFSFDLSALGNTLFSLILRELATFSSLLSRLLLLGVVGALFHVFAGSFPQSGVS